MKKRLVFFVTVVSLWRCEVLLSTFFIILTLIATTVCCFVSVVQGWSSAGVCVWLGVTGVFEGLLWLWELMGKFCICFSSTCVWWWKQDERDQSCTRQLLVLARKFFWSVLWKEERDNILSIHILIFASFSLKCISGSFFLCLPRSSSGCWTRNVSLRSQEDKWRAERAEGGNEDTVND